MCKKIYPNGLPDVCDNRRYNMAICSAPKPENTEYLAYNPVVQGLSDVKRKLHNFEHQWVQELFLCLHNITNRLIGYIIGFSNNATYIIARI